MLTKAEKTKQYILETVGPYFNKHGYTGTSLSDITKATGLSKGAIYGNFENKEELALEAFNYNIRQAMGTLRAHMDMEAPGISKLFAITNFYRSYYLDNKLSGGCPMLNMGIDSMNHNSILYNRVVDVMNKLVKGLSDLIEQAKSEGAIKDEIDSDYYANQMYAQIQGSIFMSYMRNNNRQMVDMMNSIDQVIRKELMT
ncbi:TetR/AcrR family transcriptional regulator [Reichenbachiella versicolor]|uniref:TetR/AcrR family transcriptional regulator n=1 Tax=Reichenbachiella versicolor TaxID=1821036 RepID=UPI000D6E4FA9|nr:TetR/AcrR family transcriptional regulator [Reichenbachiella versicolor]